MMRFRDYKLEEFLSDDFFVQWVKNPSEDTRHFWEKWIAENPEKREEVQLAADVVRRLRYQSKSQMSDKQYIDLFENIIKADEVCATDMNVKKQRNFLFFHWKGLAASILVLLCFYLTYQIIVADRIVQDPIIEQISWNEKSNPKGVRSRLSLADGSTIYLNSNSKIKFPSKFESEKREVILEGEAFFEIEKDGRPFFVRNGNNLIEVLGTSFNVKNGSGNTVSIALVEGKVKVDDLYGNQFLLMPNELLILESDGKFMKSDFDPFVVAGWKDKYLVFSQDDFKTVMDKISDWYGIELEIQSSVSSKWRYSGEYHNESLENVLKGIQLTSGLKYEIEGKKVIINKP